MAFSSSLEFLLVMLGIFSLPNSLSTSQVHLRCLTAANTDRRSHCPLPPGTMSSILLAKHFSFEHSIKSHPVIISRTEEDINNQTKVFQHRIDNHSTSSFLHDQCAFLRVTAGAVDVGGGPSDIGNELQRSSLIGRSTRLKPCQTPQCK